MVLTSATVRGKAPVAVANVAAVSMAAHFLLAAEEASLPSMSCFSRATLVNKSGLLGNNFLALNTLAT